MLWPASPLASKRKKQNPRETEYQFWGRGALVLFGFGNLWEDCRGIRGHKLVVTYRGSLELEMKREWVSECTGGVSYGEYFIH